MCTHFCFHLDLLPSYLTWVLNSSALKLMAKHLPTLWISNSFECFFFSEQLLHPVTSAVWGSSSYSLPIMKGNRPPALHHCHTPSRRTESEWLPLPATLYLAAEALLGSAAVRLCWGASVKVATPWSSSYCCPLLSLLSCISLPSAFSYEMCCFLGTVCSVCS